MKDWQKNSVCLLVIMLVLTVLFWPVVCGRSTLVPTDILNQLELPFGAKVTHFRVKNHFVIDSVADGCNEAIYFQRCVRAGQCPIWTPDVWCGFPYYAVSTLSFACPLQLVCWLLLPMPAGYDWGIMLHFLAAAIFMYFLLRHWRLGFLACLLGALAYCLNTEFIFLYWHSTIRAFAWMPLVILFFDKAVRSDGPRYGVVTGFFAAQRDLKRLLAYSSINHLGYCLLGIFALARFTGLDAASATAKAAALNGVFLQMFNHGLTASTLFWLVGMIEQRSGGLRGLNDFGGLRRIMPVFCGLMGIALFSSLGLPGLNGFIGEFLIFKGAFALVTWATALSAIGLLLTAIFMLTILERVFNGPLNAGWSKMPDLTVRERLAVLPAIALMFVLGVCPQLVLGITNSTVVQMVNERTF